MATQSCAGKTSQEIATILDCSLQTARLHLNYFNVDGAWMRSPRGPGGAELNSPDHLREGKSWLRTYNWEAGDDKDAGLKRTIVITHYIEPPTDSTILCCKEK